MKLKSLMIWVLCCPLVLQAQQELSLEQAEAYALEHSPRSRKARLTQESAEIEVKKTISEGLPQVNGSIQFQDNIQLPTQLIPGEFTGGTPGEYAEIQFGTDMNMTAGLSASQLIFDGSYFVGLEAAKLYAEFTAEMVEMEDWQLRDAVAQAYYTVVVLEANLEIIRDTEDVLSKSLQDTEAMYAGGFVEEMDVDQQKVSLATIENRRRYSEEMLNVNIQRFKFVIGMPQTEVVTLVAKVEDLIREDAGYLLSEPLDLERNPTFKVQHQSMLLQEQQVRYEKSQYLPKLSAFYNVQANAQRDEFNFTDFSEKWYPAQFWGLNLSIPVFNGLGRMRSVDQAEVEYKISSLEFDQMTESVVLEHKTALAEFRYAIDNFNTKKVNYDLTVRIHERTRIKYQSGMSSSFELTQATNQMISQQGEFVSSALNLLNAKSRLRKALNKYN